MPGRRALRGGRRDVDDRPGAPLAHPRQRGPRRADGAEEVELERRLPDLVRHVLELPDLAVADVVHEHVETPVPLDRLAHDALRLARLREVGPHSPPLRPVVTTVAPSARSSFAVSSPIPPVEPVTRQTLSASPRSMAG